MSLENFNDYFSTIELDISQYNKDNCIKYKNTQPIMFDMKNLQSMSSINISEMNDDLYDTYFINNNDRPDTISMKLYENVNFWWVNLLVNNITYYDMPLEESNLQDLAIYLYETEYKYSSVDIYYNKLKEINDMKREIKVIKPKYLYIILRKIYDYMKVK
jgi:hypothetical protein